VTVGKKLKSDIQINGAFDRDNLGGTVILKWGFEEYVVRVWI
jgi:hypothetical protein